LLEKPIKIIYQDDAILVCIKPAGVLSTEEPGQMVCLIKETIGKPNQEVYVIHRLDKEVSGVMVYALNKKASASLNQQIEEKIFEKKYLAVVSGKPSEPAGRYEDLLLRIQSENKTYVVDHLRKGVRDAALTYELLAEKEGKSLVQIHLLTGRTHQIRAQFSSRKMPLLGDRKYGSKEKLSGIALFSYSLKFLHPMSRKMMEFSQNPPEEYPWEIFDK